ncbi:oligoribonuclease [Blochmannia endosymbiont of Camponotus sp. C-003]|uniref:oligoribonuclease n=1 Tax=unclassified Candidatus Blochmanniella TaxID=711328 RepID=UPI0020243139|nr:MULTISPECIES: oligoribonuclease [unclassified Candidatus Blochmannia]URJ23157.1 oligoribonuclease [Blochmannia endosymbiont of Camponotus sp. C-003]URJ28626.1 oligoribonuclease [Blochmannia endosymbiont of Camponotus sp. C-046]
MRDNNLIWLDLEMTGLDPDRDRILELATLVTDSKLNILSEGPVAVIHQSESQLLSMDDWNTRVHSATGLIEKVRCSTLDEISASNLTIKFLRNWVNFKKSPICGNSIAQDRLFLFRYMPELESYFNHRYLDVSTIKELMIRWRPDLISGLQLQHTHCALDDIRESVAELMYYRKHFIRLKGA